MASAKCAREECGKTVYPVEELKCLDKIWHKGCFRCTACGMTLSMKTYKGYEKKPYCDAHYPKTVPSAFTASLDLDRAKQNTALQSSVKYHENYEKMKGTKIDVVDDPETKRLLENTQKQSLAHYHGEQKKKEEQDQHREHREGQGQQQPSAEFFNHSPSMDSLGSAYSHASSGLQNHPIGNGHSHQAHYAYGQPSIDKDNSPYTQRVAQQAHGTIIYSSEMGGQVTPDDKQVGSIADYDPMKAEQQKSAPAAAGGGGKAPAGGAQTGFTVKALYDYNAADKDEVSFKEGDVIVNCQKVDDGWFTGTVQRTLLWGMLPANYVEKVAQPTGMFRVK